MASTAVKATKCYLCEKKGCPAECRKCEVRKRGECKFFFMPVFIDDRHAWLCGDCWIKWMKERN